MAHASSIGNFTYLPQIAPATKANRAEQRLSDVRLPSTAGNSWQPPVR
jgi:hypothetical protein